MLVLTFCFHQNQQYLTRSTVAIRYMRIFWKHSGCIFHKQMLSVLSKTHSTHFSWRSNGHYHYRSFFPNIPSCYSFVLRQLPQQTPCQVSLCSRGSWRLEGGGGGGSGWEKGRCLSPSSSMCLWLSVKITLGAGQVEKTCPWVITKTCEAEVDPLFSHCCGICKHFWTISEQKSEKESDGYLTLSHLLRSPPLEEGNEVSGDSPGWTFWW